MFGLLALAQAFLCSLMAFAGPPTPVQATRLPEPEGYVRVSGISGNLSNVGSDSLANLLTIRSETFKKQYPSGGGQVFNSALALAQGTGDFGPVSPLKTELMRFVLSETG